MMPPGHVAATWGVAAMLQQHNPTRRGLDYRLLAVSALAPDLIDKPLALVVFPDSQASQLIAHSLLLNLILLTATLLFRPRALPYILAFSLHLVADRMWNHAESFWWPLFGWDVFWQFKPMNTPEAMFQVYLDIITRYPQVWVIEVMALLFLGWFIYRRRLYRREPLKQFLLTGRLTDRRSSENRSSSEDVGPPVSPPDSSGFYDEPGLRP